ncbi:MAG: glycosyltransferase [Calditrichaeota bacterium]|nr:MAG: glycosyltransferase [Calditrichota bacterium]
MMQVVLLTLYILTLIVLGLFGIHKYYLLYLYRKYKKNPLPNPPIPDEWPLVTVQLPIYNEKYVLKRLLKATVQLDYPREKLHIQVLDDSTDSTSRLAEKLVALLRSKGYQIDHLRRPNREGFKAGALSYGLERTAAEYIAIFDADFVPDPDFLKQTIPHLMQPGIGMVQARWGHINRNYSLLTQLQAIFLDAHFLIEHLARHRSGRFFNFNGTAGVWRKQAIYDAGGWQHDTLTEDLDLSYRAQLAGWKFLFLPHVVAPAELPAEMNAYKGQQHRWAKGSVQTALKLYRKIWKSNFPLHIRMEAIIHLSNNFAYLIMSIPAFLLVPIVKIHIEMGVVPWKLVIIYFLVFLSATLSVVVYYSVTIKDSLGKLWPHVLYLPFLMALGIGLSINNGRAALEALLGHQSEFNRTPKYRLEGKRGTWKKKFYRPGKSYQHIFELLMAGYFTYGWAYFLSQNIYYSMPFFVLFMVGFYYISLSSLYGQRR